ncbi:lysophospholipase L1-like esterase [Bradyrhizobium sp. S3.9.2]|uniref:SGNH/GDSL hydrolase family protein n=1 Tax=Bradyrhizobium sp. S3.9.2 TaxID=3156432 RepID=UPI0033916C7E
MRNLFRHGDVMWGVGAQRIGTGGGSEYPPIAGLYAANDPLIAYTDCVAPSYVGGFMRFQRPINDAGTDFQYCMPGARQRFRSNAASVTVQLRWNGLVTRTDSRNLIGHVFVDGVFNSNFQTPGTLNQVVTSTITINMGSSADRLYEIVLPYADGVEFGSIQVAPPSVVTAAAARTGRLMLCYGDSITQGFKATDLRRSWPYLLAANRGFRCINMGYGGRVVIPSDGTACVNLAPDLMIVMTGTNEYLAQTPVANYQANLSAFLPAVHAVNPTVPVYLCGTIYNAASLPIPLSSYANVAGNVIAALGCSQFIGVDRATLISDPGTQIGPDGTHPTDAGEVQIATGWGAAIT